MTDKEKLENALLAIEEFSAYDGSHHKQWAIDQVLRALLGCPKVKKYDFEYFGENEAYEKWVTNYENGEDGPFTYEWDTGIAP